MKTLKFAVCFMLACTLCAAQNYKKAGIIKNSKGIIESVEFDINDKDQAIPKSSNEFFNDWLKI